MDVKNTHSITKTEISVFGRQALDAERRRSPALAGKVLRYQPITTAVVTDACLNTRWHHGAHSSTASRESLGMDRVVTMYVVQSAQ